MIIDLLIIGEWFPGSVDGGICISVLSEPLLGLGGLFCS
jgi:hypothetical protein